MDILNQKILELDLLIDKKSDQKMIKAKSSEIVGICVKQRDISTDDFVREKTNLIRLNAESIMKSASGMDFLGRPVVFDYNSAKMAIEGMKQKIKEINEP